VVFAKEPATAILYTPNPNTNGGAERAIDYGISMVIDIPAGINKLRYPLHPGKTMAIRLERAGATALDYKADGFMFDPSPQVYNFNAWVGWKAGP
jgi:glucan endo-1,3-alpha-glucosidase